MGDKTGLLDNSTVTNPDLGGSDQRWEHLARTDPLWAILSEPEKRGGGWDLEAFFATGEAEIAALMVDLETLKPDLPKGSALDFGCGVGRLTRALGRRFETVTGVDVSPTMIEMAQRYASEAANCEFRLNPGADLHRFEEGSFDLVYSSITLQHVPAKAALGYVREFVRLLKPGGVAVFQLPTPRRITLKARVAAVLPRSWRSKRHGGIEMYGAPREQVLEAIAASGAEVLEVQPDVSAGAAWESYRYAVTKPL
jgi:2-polyprenyl-3-methyl-5-hydroxy-6-metoxy-1,4-benzoquinol methylase